MDDLISEFSKMSIFEFNPEYVPYKCTTLHNLFIESVAEEISKHVQHNLNKKCIGCEKNELTSWDHIKAGGCMTSWDLSFQVFFDEAMATLDQRNVMDNLRKKCEGKKESETGGLDAVLLLFKHSDPFVKVLFVGEYYKNILECARDNLPAGMEC